MTARRTKHLAIVGGGPAGLIAAHIAITHGARVDLYDAMPSVGRKLLVAGVGGLNLTHSEPLPTFIARFGTAADAMRPALERFPPEALRRFVAEFGVETKIGSSGRVFPVDLKAAPLLRALVRDLRHRGVTIHTRHRLVAIAEPRTLSFQSPTGTVTTAPDAVILAMGGASWGRLGSDGVWMPLLRELGVAVRPFEPSNCGFEIAWSPHFRERFAGEPLKNIVVRCGEHEVAGEAMLTKYGIEGGAVYPHSAALRGQLAAAGSARLEIDLKPAWSREDIEHRLLASAETRSLSGRFVRALRAPRVLFSLLREVATTQALADATCAAKLVKALPLVVRGTRPLAEAISSAGGVRFDSVSPDLELLGLPGVFVAGEMLDYDPPTGGYLLQAAFSTGVRAAEAALGLSD